MTTTHKLGAKQRWVALLALAGGVSLLGGACSRAHLSSYYGQSYAAWFGMQHIRNEPAASEPTKRALGSLDAQEATAISKNYRRTVGGNDAVGPGQGQMVMIGPNRGSTEGYTPSASSVPNGGQ